MKKLKVILKKIPATTYTYDFEFEDSKGVKVSVKDLPNKEEALWSIKDKTKKLKDYEVNIVEC